MAKRRKNAPFLKIVPAKLCLICAFKEFLGELLKSVSEAFEEQCRNVSGVSIHRLRQVGFLNRLIKIAHSLS